MPYLYVTAGIFPCYITFTVVVDSLLEPVISFTFVSKQNLFFIPLAIKVEVMPLASMIDDYILIIQYKFTPLKTFYRTACFFCLN